MPGDMAQRIDRVFDEALGSRIVGAVLMVTKGGEAIYRRAGGFAVSGNKYDRIITSNATVPAIPAAGEMQVLS